MPVGARGAWTISKNMVDTETGPDFVKGEFVMAAWALLEKQVKVSLQRSASKAFVDVTGLLSLVLLMWQRQSKIRLLVDHNLARSLILKAKLISESFEKFNPK